MIAFYTFSFGRKGYPFLELHATQETLYWLFVRRDCLWKNWQK